ncbi:unnamed protein product [Larinioides sclopetarius]|uniref:Thyroglobulin type-1 domain-containing protein n=1 Tax=Larinioides sclopetarius TaxID=280406 RepID=A0AAV2AMZ5_9ARAC
MNMQRYVSFLLLVLVISFAFAHGDYGDEYPTRRERPCDYDREKIKDQYVNVIYIPQCDENGYYQKFQCTSFGFECFCVDSYGDFLDYAKEPENCE